MKERSKHRMRVETAVVAEAVLVKVGLEVLPAHRVIHAADPTLYKAPEAFDGVRMNISHHVDPLEC